MGQLESAPTPESQVTNVNQNTDRVNRVIVDFTPQNNQIFNQGRNGDQNGAVTHDGKSLTFDTASIYGDKSGTGIRGEYRAEDSKVKTYNFNNPAARTNDSADKTYNFNTPGEKTPAGDHNHGEHSLIFDNIPSHNDRHGDSHEHGKHSLVFDKPDRGGHIIGNWRQSGESADAQYSKTSDNSDSHGHDEHHGRDRHSEGAAEHQNPGDNAFESTDRSSNVTDEQIADLMKNMEELMKGFQEMMNKYMDMLAEFMKNRGSGGTGGGDTPQPPSDPPSPPSTPPAPPSPPPTGDDDGDGHGGCGGNGGHGDDTPPSPPPPDNDTPPTGGDTPPTGGDTPPTGGDGTDGGTAKTNDGHGDGIPLATKEQVDQAMERVTNRGTSQGYADEVRAALAKQPKAFLTSFLRDPNSRIVLERDGGGIGGTFSSDGTITLYESAKNFISPEQLVSAEFVHFWDLGTPGSRGANFSSRSDLEGAYDKAVNSGMSTGDNSLTEPIEFMMALARHVGGNSNSQIDRLFGAIGAEDVEKAFRDALIKTA